MELPPTVKEYKILETAEDIQERRRQVLQRYAEFKEATKRKREKLEDSRRFLYFQRDASELESWIREKMQVAGDESYRDKVDRNYSGLSFYLRGCNQNTVEIKTQA